AVTTLGGLGVACPEFGHNIYILTALPKRWRQRLLGCAKPIRFRGVKAVDADVDRPLHRLLKLPCVNLAIGPANLPAAKTHRRDLQVCLPKLSIFHTIDLQKMNWKFTHSIGLSGGQMVSRERRQRSPYFPVDK